MCEKSPLKVVLTKFSSEQPLRLALGAASLCLPHHYRPPTQRSWKRRRRRKKKKKKEEGAAKDGRKREKRWERYRENRKGKGKGKVKITLEDINDNDMDKRMHTFRSLSIGPLYILSLLYNVCWHRLWSLSLPVFIKIGNLLPSRRPKHRWPSMAYDPLTWMGTPTSQICANIGRVDGGGARVVVGVSSVKLARRRSEPAATWSHCAVALENGVFVCLRSST